METSLLSFIIWVESSKYVLLFLGCFVQGPLVAVASGFLFNLGTFDILPMYIAIFLGNLSADVGWYMVGRFGTRGIVFKYGYFLGITKDKLNNIENYFHLHHQKILIFFKLTAGLGFTIIAFVAAGMFKIPFKKYLLLMFLSNIIWVAVLLGIGYSFGNVFMTMSTTMKIVSSLVIITIIIFGIYHMKKYVEKKI